MAAAAWTLAAQLNVSEVRVPACLPTWRSPWTYSPGAHDQGGHPCNAGDVQFAVALLADASARGLCLDISTYKVMLPAVAKAGLIEEAFRLFPSLYAAIIKALCKAGRFADALAFFGDMKTKGHPPNRPVYVMLVKMCVRGGRFVEAANYLVEMSEAGFTPRAPTFNAVVDGLRHCGKHDLARRLEQLEMSLKGN
ncbi:unnamed protein product [Urochloa humidicola]